MTLERVSVEPSRRCRKACAFCYNGSAPEGDGEWTADEVIAFGADVAAHGVRSLSLGGGEPLEWAGVFDVLAGLEGVLLRSLTTNGLPLSDAALFERRLERCREVDVAFAGLVEEVGGGSEHDGSFHTRFGVGRGVNCAPQRVIARSSSTQRS